MQKSEIQIYTDGGSRGNPGKAACAFVIYQKGKELHKGSKYLGITTNNVAEYSGVLLALEWIVNNISILPINFFLDSELVVKQLNGIYKIKDEKMKILSFKIMDLIKRHKLVINFINIPRADNKEADRLVNSTLDNVLP